MVFLSPFLSGASTTCITYLLSLSYICRRRVLTPRCASLVCRYDDRSLPLGARRTTPRSCYRSDLRASLSRTCIRQQSIPYPSHTHSKSVDMIHIIQDTYLRSMFVRVITHGGVSQFSHTGRKVLLRRYCFLVSLALSLLSRMVGDRERREKARRGSVFFPFRLFFAKRRSILLSDNNTSSVQLSNAKHVTAALTCTYTAISFSSKSCVCT